MVCRYTFYQIAVIIAAGEDMEFIEKIRARAKSLQKRLVLSEGAEIQSIRAARIILDEELASSVTLLGRESEIEKLALKESVSLNGMNLVDPLRSREMQKYAAEYYSLRKLHGVTQDMAKTEVTSPLRWGAMMVHLDEADALVGGADNDQADVLWAGLAIIGTTPGVKTASSCFVIQSNNTSLGVDGALIFSDCTVVPSPLPDQLADIAISSAQSCRDFLGKDPAVAMISYTNKSTRTVHKDVQKVKNAMEIIVKREPGLLVDGELQMDTALIPEVSNYKAPGSPLAGRANTLVFPDMESANPAYKTAVILGGAEAYGPFLQGFAKPVCFIPRKTSVIKIIITCTAALSKAK